MTRDEARECIRFYNGHFPEKGLTEDGVTTFSIRLAPLEVGLATEAIERACDCAAGWMPDWGAVQAEYDRLEMRRHALALASEVRLSLAEPELGPWVRYWTQVVMHALTWSILERYCPEPEPGPPHVADWLTDRHLEELRSQLYAWATR